LLNFLIAMISPFQRARRLVKFEVNFRLSVNISFYMMSVPMIIKKVLIATIAALLLSPGLASADLIITEFMANPTDLADASGEYFELFNSGPNAIDVGSLTIADDGTNSVNLSAFAGTLINPGDFFVLGNNNENYVNVNYGSGFTLANAADEIVVIDTATSVELARLDYSNGDPFGAGTAAVLDDTANSSGGLTLFSSYIPEISANNTLPPGADIGSPGVAGSTIASSIPEPASAIVLGMGSLAWMTSRRRR